MRRVSNHIRSNVVGYVALFVALSGTAYAVDGPLAGQNTVGSADIINNDVQTADIKDANVAAVDVRAGAITSGKILDSEVRGIDVLNDSLTGADIDESTLARPIYAKVTPTGDVDPAQSEGITDANVYKPTDTTGIYCFTNLPIQAKSAVANSISAAIATSTIVATSGFPGGCAVGDDAVVEQRRTDNQELIDQYFTVWFTD